MTPPDEDMLAKAINSLIVATRPDQVAASVAAIAAGMGMERYSVIDMQGDVAALHHNAPTELVGEVASLVHCANDPIVARAQASPIPFRWEAGEGGAWRDRHGDHGYRSGVAAAHWVGGAAGSIVILSCAADRIADGYVEAAMRWPVLAAAMLADAFRRLGDTREPQCPLAARELDCLLHAIAGRSAKQTARSLGIDYRTVEKYLERARDKLQASSSYAAATSALRHGWLDIGQALELATSETRAR